MEEPEIKITETETLMSDGSTHVHCEAVHDGQRIAAGYIVLPAVALPGCTALDFVHLGNGSYELREDRRARHREMAHKAIANKVAELRASSSQEIVKGDTRAVDFTTPDGVIPSTPIVSFNPRTCDPMGEGEALAEAITDAVAESDSGAIGALLQAARCLGAEVIQLDDADQDDLVTVMFENDTWRERLKTAIATAETWIAEVDASKPTE